MKPHHYFWRGVLFSCVVALVAWFMNAPTETARATPVEVSIGFILSTIGLCALAGYLLIAHGMPQPTSEKRS